MEGGWLVGRYLCSRLTNCTDGGGGFFLASENLGRMFDHLLSACAFFVCVEISSRTLIPLFLCQDESTVVRQAETTVTECYLTNCV